MSNKMPDNNLFGNIEKFGNRSVYRRLGINIPIEAERHYYLTTEGFDIDASDTHMELSKEWSPVWKYIREVTLKEYYDALHKKYSKDATEDDKEHFRRVLERGS